MTETHHVVVDGSNLATEGRSSPSLAQLDQAVRAYLAEDPGAEIVVVVDASFSHRIDPTERSQLEAAELHGEVVAPPAGAIGRGDAFVLRIAERTGAVVLSNDSFQEFHGEHPWLFERGRLLGATPVPGVGWIFTPRTPVRGPKSHRAVRDTDRAKKKVSKAIEAATKEAVSPPVAVAGRAPAAPRRASKKAVAEGSEPALPRASSRRSSPPPSAAAAVNDPLTFISFIAEHPLGTEVVGRVESYTSHGAVVFVGGVQCYVPLANMAEPPPRSAREVLKKDEERTLVVTALDPLRRGVELAVPGVAVVSGRPSEEMIAAEVRLARKAAAPAKATARPRKSAAGRAAAPATTPAAAPPPKAARGRRPAAPVEKAPAPPRMRANGAAKKGPASLRSQAAAPARKATALPAKNAAVARPAKASAPSKRAAPAKRSAPVSASKQVQAAPARKVQAAPAKKVQAAPVKKASPAPGRSAAGSAGAKKVAARAAEPAKKASAPGPIAGRRSNRNRPTR